MASKETSHRPQDLAGLVTNPLVFLGFWAPPKTVSALRRYLDQVNKAGSSRHER